MSRLQSLIPGSRWILIGLLLLMAIIGMRGYVTDDTWIHLRYARNLIDLGEFSFNPGEATYGATSPLWIFGLALLLKLGIAPILSAKILGVLSAILMLAIAGWIIDRIINRMRLPGNWWLWLMLLMATDAWFQRWTMSGMETPLAGALLLAILIPACARQTNWLAFGVVAALAALTRPEFILFGPAALPWLLRYCARRGEKLRAIAGSVAGWLLMLAPWWIYAWITFGRITPETASAKSYGLSFAPVPLAMNLLRSVAQLGMIQGVVWLGFIVVVIIWWTTLRKQEALGATDPEIAARLAKREAPPRGLRAMTGIVATWLVLLLGGYALKQVWVISRYVSPLLPPMLLVLGGWAAWMTWDREAVLGPRWYASKRLGRTRSVMLTCAVLCLTVNAMLLNQQVHPHTVKFSRGVNTCFYGTGEWLAENTPEDAVIAAHDIGAVGYASGRRILDLAGLVSPEILAMGREMGFEAMVASGLWLKVEVPDYVYDRTKGPPRWQDETLQGVRFELLQTCNVEGVGLREPQIMTYALYRLHP